VNSHKKLIACTFVAVLLVGVGTAVYFHARQSAKPASGTFVPFRKLSPLRSPAVSTPAESHEATSAFVAEAGTNEANGIAQRSVAGGEPGKQTTPTANQSAISSDEDELLKEALACMSRQAFDKAIPPLRQALDPTTDAQQRRMIQDLLAECLMRTQKFDEAKAIEMELLAESTGDQEKAATALKLAHLSLQQMDFASAERIIEDTAKQIQTEPARTQLQNGLLRVWQQQPGRLAQVSSNLEEKVAADSTDQQSLELLSTIYYRIQHDYMKAKPVYQQLVFLQPTNTQLRQTLITIYQETSEFDKARGIYEEFLAEHPENADGLNFQIAALYARSGRGDDAVGYAEQHLGGKQATPERLQLLARVYEVAGRLDDSAKVLQTAEAAETNASNRAELRFQQADLLTRQQRYEPAESIIRTILANFGAEPSIKARANSELFRLYQLQGKTNGINF